jgi:hypothetical protein
MLKEDFLVIYVVVMDSMSIFISAVHVLVIKNKVDLNMFTNYHESYNIM